MQRRAFSLLEMSIVLTILALVMSIFLSLGRSIYDMSKSEATKYELQAIKNSLIAHIAVRGNLPQSDSDGDGHGDTTDIGDLPYIDLNLKLRDKYGIPYQYDVSNSLTSSDDSNVCIALSEIFMQLFDINTSTTYPQVVDELNNSKYAVAAVVISKGVDKTLSGNNSDTDRKYEMATNRYNAANRDDLVLEISALEIMGTICDLSGSGGGDVVVSSPMSIVAIGDVYYNTDIDPTCFQLLSDANVTAYPYQTFRFYQSDDNVCERLTKSISYTYGVLQDLDLDPNDNIVNVIEEINSGTAPTLIDNWVNKINKE